jgi:hypothetical protein
MAPLPKFQFFIRHGQAITSLDFYTTICLLAYYKLSCFCHVVFLVINLLGCKFAYAKKKKTKYLGIVLILFFGFLLIVWIWLYYNAQLNEIGNTIEQVNKK